MHEIRIVLTQAASLGTLAAPGGGGAAALPGGMPGAPGGIYLIVNTTTNSRYAGISSNTQTRFTGRMAVVNELGLGAPTMANVWAWWGRISTRHITQPATFAAAFPTTLANLPLANRYAMPGGVGTAATNCPNPLTLAAPVAPVPSPAGAQDEVTRPIRVAVAAYQAWTASVQPPSVATITAAWPGLIVALPGGIAAVVSGQGSAQAAANAAAIAVGAPGGVAAAAAAAVQAYATGGGPPPPSDVRAVVHSYYLGPALPPALPGGWPVPVFRNPVQGPPTTLTHVLPGAGLVDLEWVFIRFVLQHLVGGPGVAYVTNGLKTGPLGWPGGGEPICITWHSCAGAVFAPFDRSVIWWPNSAF